MKKFVSLLIAVLLITALAVPAMAAGTVTYDGYANEFIFEPGSESSPTDLFENFKNVMPGDTLTQQIEIRNDSARNVKIRVYLRSLGAQEDTDEFLNQMKLTVEKVGKTTSDTIYEAPADETDGLTDWKPLGTIGSGGKITLDLTLEVPITMGNDFADQTGYIDWEFKVEEIPVSSHQTGDDSQIFLYGALMVFSLSAIIVLVVLGKRKKETE